MATTAKIFNFNVDGNEIAIRVSMSFDNEVFKWGATRNRFNVYVSCNGHKLRTKYHDCVHNYWKGKTEADESDLFDALRCILNDATAAVDCRDFWEYKENYGGTIAEYKACNAMLAKLTEMFGGDEFIIFDILNIMNEEDE